MPRDTWPVVGEAYDVDGEFHEFRGKYGQVTPQITAKVAVRIRTSGRLIRPWLELLPGIGPTRSKRLLDAYGSDVVTYLGDTTMTRNIGEVLEPDRPDSGERLAATVQMHYIAHQANENVAIAEGDFLLKLEECGVSDRPSAKKMFRLIGSIDAFEQLKRKPYLAACLLPWKEADHLGLRLLSQDSTVSRPNLHPDRLAGACSNVWRSILQDGDTAISRENFLRELANRRVNPAKALQIGIEQRRILDTGGLLRAPGAAYLESSLAEKLLAFEQSAVSGVKFPVDIDRIVRSHEDPKRPLMEEQRHAVCGILKNKFSILQGGAGTGKTTTLKVLVDTWVAQGGDVVLGALCGIAALRMSRSTGRLAQTLARHLLRFERSAQTVEANGSEMFPELTSKTMVVVDEASMVDLVTLRKLALIIPEGAIIVLVGDMGQLPPVGLGQVYLDLVDFGINVFHLNEVHRQAAGNPIIAAATAVRTGQIPELPKFAECGVGVFHLDAPFADIDTSIIGLLDRMVPTVPLEDILVVAALRRTCSGINRSMQVRRQLAGHEGMRIGPLSPWVSIGEPVICTRNRYQDALMNGMIGHVNTLSPLTVRWDGDELGKKVPPEAYVDIASAWAITCHRAQGSESRFVIVALDDTEFMTREWLYTAITRATEQVILVGPLAQVEAAIARRSKRITFFKQELEARRQIK
jgi:exodeoxyribonuclease V alpha subunit